MPIATNPIFVSAIRWERADVSSANTNRDGTGTIADVFTGAARGSLIERVVVVATGTVTAGVVRLFIHNGTNWRLWKEVMVTATTPSTSVETFRSEFTPDGGSLPLPSASYKLGASTHNAETFAVHAIGGDF